MRITRTIGRFIRQYLLLSLAVAAAAIGLILELTGLHTPAHWLLGIVSLAACVPLAKEMWDDLRIGKYGIDILALTAIITSVILHQYWAAMVIVLMFTGGVVLEAYAEHRAKSELDALLERVP